MTQTVTVKNVTIGEGLPKICVPMVGTTREALRQEAKAIREAAPELAEWRADFYEAVEDWEALEDTLRELTAILEEIPLIFTIRSEKEGGNLAISTQEYMRINQKVAELALASLIDVEVLTEERKMKALIETIHKNGGKVIASSHNFDSTPSGKELIKILKKLDRAGGDILKIAVMPHTLFDVWELLETTNQMTQECTKKPIVTISMGELGGFSRFAGEIFGSSITFGVVGRPSAPGQMPVEELRDMMGLFHTEIGF